MAKGTIGNKYFNIETGAVIKPVFDYDELGGDYELISDKCYPVYDMRHGYVGYIQENVFNVAYLADGSKRD